jgi:uncharacterized damage-inducible protein DinB
MIFGDVRHELAGTRRILERVPDERWDWKAHEKSKALDELDEKALAAEWTLRKGDHVIMRQPRAAALRGFGINHMIHHRAQLGVYLRLLNVPVPGLYGPSADEQDG